MPVELLGKSAQELREFLMSLGERPYRAPQIHRAIYTERRFDFAAMTNVPATLARAPRRKKRASRFRASCGGLRRWMDPSGICF